MERTVLTLVKLLDKVGGGVGKCEEWWGWMERWSGGGFAGDGCCGRGASGGIGDWLEGGGTRDEGWEGLRRGVWVRCWVSGVGILSGSMLIVESRGGFG